MTELLSSLIVGLIFITFFAIMVVPNYFVSARGEEELYSFAFKWGNRGNGEGQFMRPHAIDFDSQGNVYVSERTNNYIQKFTNDGRFILIWGKEGIDKGQFRSPYSLTIDKLDNIYVVDKDNNRIQKFDTNGKFVQMWDKFITSNGTEVKMYLPEAMAVNPLSGDVYITDTGNNRTLKLDSKFNYVSEWGSYGRGEGQFDHPHGIGVDSKGNVYINELNVPRIQKFDSNGTFIKQWGSEGTGNGQFTLALEHLMVDPEDFVWLVDGEGNPRVQKFDSDGNYITSVGTGPCEIPHKVKNEEETMKSYTKCDGQLHQPEWANVDSMGKLYVVDRGNQRVEVFSR